MNRLFYLFVMILFINGCSTASETIIEPAQQSEDAPVDPISNDFLIWGTSGVTDSIDQYMKTIFEEKHPDINVVLLDMGWDEALRLNLENAIQMGRPPEVVVGENYFRTFAKDGHLQPLDDVMATQDDLIDETYAAAEYDGQIYAVPFLTGIFAFERNCAVIEAAGLSCEQPPQYHDELLAQAQHITRAGNSDYYGYTLQGPGGTAVGSAFRIAVFQAQYDALPCADDACTIPDFNRPETLPVYQFLRDLVAQTPPGLVTNTHETEVYEALFRGTSAYQIAGSWHPAWAADSGCEDCRYSPIPHPRDGMESTLLVGNVLYAAPVGSQHPELAKEWLELLISDEVQQQIFTETGRLPVRRIALEAAVELADDDTDVFINTLLSADHLQLLPQWSENPREIWAIYGTLLENVLLTDRPIADLMAEAQTEVDALR